MKTHFYYQKELAERCFHDLDLSYLTINLMKIALMRYTKNNLSESTLMKAKL